MGILWTEYDIHEVQDANYAIVIFGLVVVKKAAKSPWIMAYSASA